MAWVQKIGPFRPQRQFLLKSMVSGQKSCPPTSREPSSKSEINEVMSSSELMPFVPILSILPEFGGPFIWCVTDADEPGVGPCLCDSLGGSDFCPFPLSEGLFVKFSDWALTLDQSEHLLKGFGDDWDWTAFHARGMQLARWLKEDVGHAHRVVYIKAPEDPNYRIDERVEILADGTIVSLPPFRHRFTSA